MTPIQSPRLHAISLAVLVSCLQALPLTATSAEMAQATAAQPVAHPAASEAITPKNVLSVMERVADWQLANPSKHRSTDWTQAVGYNGMMALVGISGEHRFRDAMVDMSEKNEWKLGPRQYHADDHIVGQTYVELYLQLRDPKMIAPMRAQFDELLANPHEGSLEFTVPGNQDRWSWCDALYMGPPAWARLYAATGDQRYLDLAVNHWWRTSDYLYDKEAHLYFRDSTYFDKREANGKKVYWGRGNGWVIGGLVRMLQYLPANHPSRGKFEQQFKEMAEKLITLQQDDGMWRASLLDPASFPMKETSGTGLFTYAFAYGVNQGLLDRARFEPATRKAWNALVSNVQADGKLTHVQPIGAAPRVFDDNLTEVYGVGGFLLAGSEIYRMALLDHAAPKVVTVSNQAQLHRADETVEVNPKNKATIVMDAATSRILPSQALKQGVMFQATMAPGETRRYLMLKREQLPAVPPIDVKAHARFVPERLDDFAWESDRTAHRTYGPAIIHDPKELLVSSGVDVWVKRTRLPVLDEWYKRGDYHKDNGGGMDYYHVGKTRGCGGLGVYDGKELYNSSNFSSWKVLADGPLRAEFELRFDNWDAGGRQVAEVRHVSIDAGSNFSRVESRFATKGAAPLQIGVGIVQRKGEGHFTSDAAAGWMSYWEPTHGNDGNTGCAIVMPAKTLTGFAEHSGHYLALGKAKSNKPFVYYMGGGWSKSGDFAGAEGWDGYVRDYAARLASPLVVKVGAR